MEKLERTRNQYLQVINEDNRRRDEQLENINRTLRNIENGTVEVPKFMHELDKKDLKENFKEGPGGCGCILI